MWRWLYTALVVGSAMGPQGSFGQQSHGREREKIEAPPGPIAPANDVDRSVVVSRIIDQTNEFRRSEGMSDVSRDEQLIAAATYFADYMAEHDEYGHEADGKTPSQRAEQFQYDYCLVSENIAYQYSSRGFQGPPLAGQFVDGWKDSAGHRRNMLDSAAQQTGVAVAHSSKTGHWYAVQMFGRPRSAAIEFQIANRSASDIEYQLSERTFTLSPRYTRTHELCRPSKVVVQLPDGEKTVDPESGGSYVIDRRDGSTGLYRKD